MPENYLERPWKSLMPVDFSAPVPRNPYSAELDDFYEMIERAAALGSNPDLYDDEVEAKPERYLVRGRDDKWRPEKNTLLHDEEQEFSEDSEEEGEED